MPRFMMRYTVQFTEPDLAASSWVDSTYTVTGLTTQSGFYFHPRVALSAGYIVGDLRCSTADELTIRWVNAGASTISGSTKRGTLFEWKA